MPDDSLSFVLLAYNEEESIETAIKDCRTTAGRLAIDYEVVVVDDGSSDRTQGLARDMDNGDIRLVVHDTNKGMGASMRDGYLASTKSYMAHLPGDRQVRAQSIEAMWTARANKHCVLTTFQNPPSGLPRVAMSMVFRQLVKRVGNMRINFAGTYLFHKDWLSSLDLEQANSGSFLFSFQLLELMRREGCTFESTRIETFIREAGSSRVATPGRIAKMFREIVEDRMQ